MRHGAPEIKIKEQQALQFVLTRETKRYTLSSFECVDKIEREQKCIHPIETADFCAVLYKWDPGALCVLLMSILLRII